MKTKSNKQHLEFQFLPMIRLPNHIKSWFSNRHYLECYLHCSHNRKFRIRKAKYNLLSVFRLLSLFDSIRICYIDKEQKVSIARFYLFNKFHSLKMNKSLDRAILKQTLEYNCAFSLVFWYFPHRRLLLLKWFHYCNFWSIQVINDRQHYRMFLLLLFYLSISLAMMYLWNHQ